MCTIYQFVLARNEAFGTKAVQQIHELDPETQEKVYFYQLDITNVESIRRFADYIRKKHGGLDILINNAAIAFQVIAEIIIERKIDFIEYLGE